MPEWVANTPWWAVLGIVVVVIGALIRGAFWVGSVNTKLDSLSKTVSDGFAEVRADIKKILERQSPPPTVWGRSPIHLTDFGRELSATGSAGAWALTNAPNLEAEAAGKEEFEVFELCVSYVGKQYEADSDFQRAVKAAAHQHGIEPDQVLKVYQVELRDRLLPVN